MIEPFSWAENKGKLARAKEVAGPDASEEEIQEAYVSLGGRVIPGYEVPEVVEEVKVVPKTKTSKKK